MEINIAMFAAIAAVLEIVTTVGGGFYFMGKVTGRLDRQDEKISDLQKNLVEMRGDIKETRALITATAVHETRLSHIEADIINVTLDVRRLRRGVGWINDKAAKSVDREYEDRD